jgi:hypothetical protein
MHRTVEAIVYPDGAVKILEPILADGPHRALLTILEKLPTTPAQESHRDEVQIDEILRAAGLFDEADDIPSDLEPLSETARAELARRITDGASLTQIIHEEREERF